MQGRCLQNQAEPDVQGPYENKADSPDTRQADLCGCPFLPVLQRGASALPSLGKQKPWALLLVDAASAVRLVLEVPGNDIFKSDYIFISVATSGERRMPSSDHYYCFNRLYLCMATTCHSQYCAVKRALDLNPSGDLVISSTFLKPTETWTQILEFRNKYKRGFLCLVVWLLGLYNPYWKFFIFLSMVG